MTEPEIVAYGRSLVEHFAVKEYRESLKRAFFSEHGADFITLDSNPRGQRFLAACTAWAIDAGLLRHDHSVDDGQSKVSSFRLTERGREELSK
jgi:hypothetical protein